MTLTAADVMSRGCQCINEDEDLCRAARIMADQGVGALPICGNEGKIVGMLTDRDIVIKCLAAGKDPTVCKAKDLAEGHIVWAFASDSIEDVLAKMEQNLVRRIPIVDEHKQLCGIIAQADIAQHLDHERSAQMVETISAAHARQHV